MFNFIIGKATFLDVNNIFLKKNINNLEKKKN